MSYDSGRTPQPHCHLEAVPEETRVVCKPKFQVAGYQCAPDPFFEASRLSRGLTRLWIGCYRPKDDSSWSEFPRDEYQNSTVSAGWRSFWSWWAIIFLSRESARSVF